MVPAAERRRAAAPGPRALAVSGEMSGGAGRPSRRRRRSAALDLSEAGGSRQRMVLFIAEAELASCMGPDALVSLLGSGAARSHRDHLARLLSAPGMELELVDAGMLRQRTVEPARPIGAAPLVRLSTGLDRHRLDVALSTGRHAAERAKLAGHGLLHCAGLSFGGGKAVVPLMSPVRRARLEWGRRDWGDGDPSSDPRQGMSEDFRFVYEWLCQHADFELAALVGAMVACGQMGLEAVSWGERGAEARALVAKLHPGVASWVVGAVTPRDDGHPASATMPASKSASGAN